MDSKLDPWREGIRKINGGKLYWGELMDAMGLSRDKLEYCLKGCVDMVVTSFHVRLKEAAET